MILSLLERAIGCLQLTLAIFFLLAEALIRKILVVGIELVPRWWLEKYVPL